MKTCTRCIMDTSDPDIAFDDRGVCNHCECFAKRVIPHYWSWKSLVDPMGRLNKLVLKIKQAQKEQPYDVLIGLSGGVDSSYLAYWAARVVKLRILAIHVDGGWNSEVAVQNIKKIVTALGIELYTHVVDSEVMREVQLAFLKSGVANQDTPQDHIFRSVVYNFAAKNNIRYILSGANIATESILPRAWGHDAMDADQIKDICKKFGVNDLKKFPLVSFFKYYIYWSYINRLTIVRPLDYMNYNKADAMDILEKEFAWQYYGMKHYESVLTRFLQGYWLPTKFGYDKRKAHLSSLILSGQMTRAAALQELSQSAYDTSTLASDLDYIAKKLGITKDRLQQLMQEKNVSYRNYKHNSFKVWILNKVIFPIKVMAYIRRKLFDV